jgi:hypothetical protein
LPRVCQAQINGRIEDKPFVFTTLARLIYSDMTSGLRAKITTKERNQIDQLAIFGLHRLDEQERIVETGG